MLRCWLRIKAISLDKSSLRFLTPRSSHHFVLCGASKLQILVTLWAPFLDLSRKWWSTGRHVADILWLSAGNSVQPAQPTAVSTRSWWKLPRYLLRDSQKCPKIAKNTTFRGVLPYQQSWRVGTRILNPTLNQSGLLTLASWAWPKSLD